MSILVFVSSILLGSTCILISDAIIYLSKPDANVTRTDIIPANKEKVKDSLLNKLDHKDWYLITLFGLPYSDHKGVH
jgi:hypothetical protein